MPSRERRTLTRDALRHEASLLQERQLGKRHRIMAAEPERVGEFDRPPRLANSSRTGNCQSRVVSSSCRICDNSRSRRQNASARWQRSKPPKSASRSSARSVKATVHPLVPIVHGRGPVRTCVARDVHCGQTKHRLGTWRPQSRRRRSEPPRRRPAGRGRVRPNSNAAGI